jgi:hypothetical protein
MYYVIDRDTEIIQWGPFIRRIDADKVHKWNENFEVVQSTSEEFMPGDRFIPDFEED